jgi:hypothetical protein
MKYILILLVLVVAVACKRNEPVENSPPEVDQEEMAVEENDEETGMECLYEKLAPELTANTPFAVSNKVEIVSYEIRQYHELKDSLIRDGKFVVQGIKQRITLKKADQDSLFSILYDYGRIEESEWYGADCYDPHHSVIFYQNNQAIAFLEICFSCEDTRQSKGFNFGTYCSEKWGMLQKFFISKGADYGHEQ